MAVKVDVDVGDGDGGGGERSSQIIKREKCSDPDHYRFVNLMEQRLGGKPGHKLST